MRFIVLALCALIASVPVSAVQDHSQHQHQSGADNDPFNQDQVEYVCPMHSQIVKQEPGSCPICGMDLVKRQVETETSDGTDDQAEVAEFSVASAQQQALRVTTARVTRKDLQPTLRAQAQVGWPQSAKYHVHSRAEGWVEELYTDVEGQWVDKGDKLYRVYAPDLVVAQNDYLQLLNSLGQVGDRQQQQEFKRRGRQRLKLLGMNDRQIETLEQTQQTRYEVNYFAPRSGYLTALNIQQGMYVTPGLELMTISGDQQLWFLLDVPVRYADQVKVGQMVHLSSDAIDGHWMNRIDYLYPQVDPETQTVTARVPVDASINALREGLWATGHVELAPLEQVLVIPVKSLIQTGNNSRVLVKTGKQKFVVRKVQVGLRVDNEVEIRSGLKEGEQVVTNGQFLLDSEASLRGLQPGTEEPTQSNHAHGGH